MGKEDKNLVDILGPEVKVTQQTVQEETKMEAELVQSGLEQTWKGAENRLKAVMKIQPVEIRRLRARRKR